MASTTPSDPIVPKYHENTWRMSFTMTVQNEVAWVLFTTGSNSPPQAIVYNDKSSFAGSAIVRPDGINWATVCDQKGRCGVDGKDDWKPRMLAFWKERYGEPQSVKVYKSKAYKQCEIFGSEEPAGKPSTRNAGSCDQADLNLTQHPDLRRGRQNTFTSPIQQKIPTPTKCIPEAPKDEVAHKTKEKRKLVVTSKQLLTHKTNTKRAAEDTSNEDATSSKKPRLEDTAISNQYKEKRDLVMKKHDERRKKNVHAVKKALDKMLATIRATSYAHLARG
jgi:hypothetical protein